MEIDVRTVEALGNNLMEKLRLLQFCIVGCGGTGANFAEMLVRSGAMKLTLIDGDLIDESNLNRICSFNAADVGNSKVESLRERLDSIRQQLEIRTLQDSFREREDILDDHPLGQLVRDAVHDADVVFIGTDTNTSRLAIERLCQDRGHGMLLSCGVLVDREAGVFAFECNWSPSTPLARAADEGYGPENASFASIILEATSVAFTMLLGHLKSGQRSFRSYFRRYDSNFRPVETVIDGVSNGNGPSI